MSRHRRLALEQSSLRKTRESPVDRLVSALGTLHGPLFRDECSCGYQRTLWRDRRCSTRRASVRRWHTPIRDDLFESRIGYIYILNVSDKCKSKTYISLAFCPLLSDIQHWLIDIRNCDFGCWRVSQKTKCDVSGAAGHVQNFCIVRNLQPSDVVIFP